MNIENHGKRQSMPSTIPVSLLNHFGIASQGFYWSKSCEIRKEYIKEQIKNNEMVAVVGEIGVGKSELVRKVMGELEDAVFVRANDPNKYGLSVSGIIEDVLEMLAPGEKRKRSRGARKSQFTRIVGSYVYEMKRNVCIVIEEAHRCSKDLFRSLKELRETEFRGICPFFSVLLIGHPLLAQKLETIKEAGLRTRKLMLNEEAGWLNVRERTEYLSAVFARALRPSVRRRIATLYRTPLEMNSYVEHVMEEARNAGKTVIDDEVVQPTIRELYDAMKRSHPDEISYLKIAKEIENFSGERMEKSSVQDVINGASKSRKNISRVRRAIDAIDKRASEEKLKGVI